MPHGFEQTSPKKIGERITFLLQNGWELLSVHRYAVVFRVKHGKETLTLIVR